VTQAATDEVAVEQTAEAPSGDGSSGRRAAIDAACIDRAEQMLRPGYDFGRRFSHLDWWVLAAATLIFLVFMYAGFLL